MSCFPRNVSPLVRFPTEDSYSWYGSDIPNYDHWKLSCLSILFGPQHGIKVKRARILLCKRFLEFVFKLPPLYLDGSFENSFRYVEYADMYRCMLLCSVPVGLPDVPASILWENEEASFRRVNACNPWSALGGRANADGSSVVQPKQRMLSLKDHSWVGTLYGLWKDDSNYAWTTDWEDFLSKEYEQFRLDVNGISPSTLLMFCSMGSVEYSIGAEDDSFSFLCPKMMVNIDGFNQRHITDMVRLWASEEDKMNLKVSDGLMQVMYRPSMSVSWGNIPYVLYPHVEHLVEKKKPPPRAGLSSSSSCSPKRNAAAQDAGSSSVGRGDAEVPGLLETGVDDRHDDENDRFSIGSLIRHGNRQDTIFVGNGRRYEAYDVDYDSVNMAYRAIFGCPIEKLYVFEGSIRHQVKALLALGCLVKDVDALCQGFRDPEQNWPGLFQYLQMRVSDAIVENVRPHYEIFSMGRTVSEMFLRIRLMFRFLLGETVLGIVDGQCRLTAMSYCWLGLLPEVSAKDGLHGGPSRALAGHANYRMLTSPSVVSLITGGTSHQTKDVGPITKEMLNLVQVYSSETQRSFDSGHSLSIQSFLVQILKQYQEGLPFQDDLYRLFLQHGVDADEMYFSEAELFAVMDESLTPAKRDKWNTNRIRHFLFHTIGITPQADISYAWNSEGSLRTVQDKISFLMKVDMMKMNGSRPVIDVLCRFLLLVGVFRADEMVALTRNAYANDFLQLLLNLVVNNGKSWEEVGESIRSSLECITNPLCRYELVEKQLLLQSQEEVDRLDLELSDPVVLATLSQPDPNRNTKLMVNGNFVVSVCFFVCSCCIVCFLKLFDC